MKKAIVLENLVLYDLEGKPARRYKLLELGEKTLTDSDAGPVQSMPSSALFYAIIERLHDLKHPDYRKIRRDLLNETIPFESKTSVSYVNNEITHHENGRTYTVTLPIPVREDRVRYKEENIVKNKKWRNVLQALLMPKDLDKALSLLSGKKESLLITPTYLVRDQFSCSGVGFQAFPDTFVMRCDLNGRRSYTREIQY